MGRLHAVRGLASTELSFYSCNVLRDCHRGVPRGNKNVVKLLHMLRSAENRYFSKIASAERNYVMFG